MTCIHTDRGLCERCQADYDEDAGAWLEYGDHPTGRENWRRLLDEIAADQADGPPAEPDPSSPF